MTQMAHVSWLLLALAALVGFLLGRWTARPRETPAQVRGLIAQDRYLEAIKRVREGLGLGLKEAKELVDHIRGSVRTGAAP